MTAPSALPASLDLKRRLLWRVTLFALALCLGSAAVATVLAVRRIPQDLARTGQTIRQLIADEVGHRVSAFDRDLMQRQLSLDGLQGLGGLLHFCARLDDLYGRALAERCFGLRGDEPAALPAALERRLAAWLARLTQPAARWQGVIGAYPGIKVAELHLRPDYASEARVLGRQYLALALITLGVLGINALVYRPVRRALAPAARIEQALRAMQDGDLDQRAPRVALRELDAIARGCNHLAERLQATLAARAALARRLIAVREEERRHLARELHDELGQMLASIRAEAAFLAEDLRTLAPMPARSPADGPAPPDMRAALDSVAAVDRGTVRMMEVVHGLLSRLRPQGLDEFGLAESLRQLVDDWRRRQRAQCVYRLRLDVDTAALDGAGDALAVHLYRIVQEGLTNAAKHGAPRRVDIHLYRDAGRRDAPLALDIEDDGQGPLPGTEAAPGGHGLLGLHERVQALGGTLALEQVQPHGRRLAVRLPMPMLQDAAATLVSTQATGPAPAHARDSLP